MSGTEPWQRVGPVYARVGARWTEYLAGLDDDQIALAIDVIRRAAAINRDEIYALRATPRQSNPPRRSA